MDNKYNMLNNIFTNRFNGDEFNKFIIELLNLDSKDRLHGVHINEESSIYENHIDYVKDIGKYTDKNRKTIVASIVKLKDSPDKARTLQRNFIARHLKDLNADAAVVALYSDNSDVWRISFVKLDYSFDINKLTGNLETKEDITPAKRYSYLVEPRLKNHTVQEQLENLLFDDTKRPSLEEIENVFSVEVVTDEFFKMYRSKYLDLKEFLESNTEFIEESKRLMLGVKEFSEEFAKKLMGQIAFLYFLQKKGWLGVHIVPFKPIDRNEYNSLKSMENEDIKEIMDKVFRPSNIDKSLMELDRKALNELSDPEADWIANVFKSTRYNRRWGEGTKTFIRDLFISYSKNINEENFFNSYLEPLFYEALNERRGVNEYYKRFNCKIPFLNGGLFEPIYKYEWKKTNIQIPNEFFSNDDNTGLLDFFDMYNFTMNEDEPLEKEVAVDPEMLGKIFENLLDVKERKSKGAFYTPREIVHYMCQECLINYLNNETKIDITSLELLIKYGEVIKDVDLNIKDKKDYKMPKSIIDNLEVIDKALENVTVADPAVGSGAFPLGMLNEIVKARSIVIEYMTINLDIYDKDDYIRKNKRSLYDLKKNAMKRSIFAVDVEPSAVDITKLRLWLSLVVDADIRTVNTLPNLDYNIMVGNSLVDEFNGIKLFDEELLKERPKRKKKEISNQISMNIEGKSVNVGIEQEYQLLEDIQKLQNELFDTKENSEKVRIKKDIENKEWDLIEYKLTREKGLLFKEREELKKQRKSNRRPYFLWKLEFSKVFRNNGGFDIVIGNPPYIEFKKLDQELKDILKLNYDSAKGKYDIYVVFIEMANNLLKEGGFLSFINPTMFMKRDYGKEIRKYINQNYKIERIINFEDKQMFSSATTYTGIFMFNKSKEDISYVFDYRRLKCDISNNIVMSKILDDEEIFESISVKSSILNDVVWNINNSDDDDIIGKIKINTKELGDISERIFQGIASGKDEVFYINDDIVNEFDLETELIHPILKGKDVKKYDKQWSGTYVIYPYSKGSVKSEDELEKKYSNIYKYLVGNREKLSGRGYFDKSSKLWYELWNQRNDEYFNQIKIITAEINKNNNFDLDMDGYYGNTKIYSIILKNKNIDDYYYILGILNSTLMNYFYKSITVPKAGGFYAYKTQFIKQIPIKLDNNVYYENIVDLVKKVMNKKDEDRNKIYKEIDRYVYKLYNLNDKDIISIENKI